MSILSRIKGAKKAADEHKRSKAVPVDTSTPAPYRHVPTHAATDALLGAPAAWSRDENRARIRAQNKAKRESMPLGASESSLHSRVPKDRGSSDLSIQSVMRRGESSRSSVQSLGVRQHRQYFSHSHPTGKSKPINSSPLASKPPSVMDSKAKASQDSIYY